MPLTYSRSIHRDASPAHREEIEAQIRCHLSAQADPGDDEQALASHVVIGSRKTDGDLVITGFLDAEPQAAYLRADFDPDGESEPFEYQPFSPQEAP